MNDELISGDAVTLRGSELQSFRRELAENVWLLLELIDAIRSECALADDRFTANFFAGLHTTIAAFVARSSALRMYPLAPSWQTSPTDSAQ